MSRSVSLNSCQGEAKTSFRLRKFFSTALCSALNQKFPHLIKVLALQAHIRLSGNLQARSQFSLVFFFTTLGIFTHLLTH